MIKKLYFEIGVYSRDSYKIELKNNKIILGEGNPGNYFLKKEFEVDSNKIKQFINVLNEIDVWSWRRKYYNHEVMDGTQWELDIICDDGKKIKSYGSNIFPDSDNMEPSRLFLSLISALEKLIDGYKLVV